MAAPEIRRLTEGDEPEALELLAASAGWSVDESHAGYFRWRHRESPFGRSRGWVAVEDGRIVGLRMFMPWRLHDGEREYAAVRPVETATHPDHRGRGVSRELGQQALRELADEDFDFAFCVPTQHTESAYSDMGWQHLAHLPMTLSVRRPVQLLRLSRQRVPPEREPMETEVGEPASEVLLDAVRPLLPVGVAGVVVTPRTEAFYAWRYGREESGYRVWSPSGDAGLGLVVFRLRRRGKAKELIVNDLLMPPGRTGKRLLNQLVRHTAADHGLALAAPGPQVRGALAHRGLWPTLLWHGLRHGEPPPLDWYFTMGDVDLLTG